MFIYLLRIILYLWKDERCYYLIKNITIHLTNFIDISYRFNNFIKHLSIKRIILTKQLLFYNINRKIEHQL